MAIGVGLSRIESLGERTGPNSWTYPFKGRGQDPLHLEPDSAVPTSALPRAATEIAEEIVTRLRLRLRSSRYAVAGPARSTAARPLVTPAGKASLYSSSGSPYTPATPLQLPGT